MANTTISPNMGMPVPVVSVDPGPDWATNIDACLSVIDSHNHSPGQGVQITPDGINISSDLTMGSNNLTNARSVRFTAQGAPISQPADLGCLYESGVDLYYNDGVGNAVRITQSGSVTGATGTITGLPSGTASASFAGSTFTFQSATNTPANMAVGPLIIGANIASSKTVTLAPSVSQPANYALTLPTALPALNSVMSSDSSGNLSFVTTIGTIGNTFDVNGLLEITNNTGNMEILGGAAGIQFNVGAGSTGTASVFGISGIFSVTNVNSGEFFFGYFNPGGITQIIATGFAVGTGAGTNNKITFSPGVFTITNNNGGTRTYAMFSITNHS